ncbi:Hypothetical protein PHPALM_6967 [Phytophthora palmivora]|uniref:Uncharacterized protein n=1 Tax=Phytophthora palmivora TaxID=4796 RepID=A0A2P4YDJ3_9STRA|nr:Hypothetical protein PHPALM_6967 [Phytophthora palmivora]
MSDAGLSLQDAAREFSTSKLLVGTSSGMSLLGALAMIAHYLVFQESRRCGRRLLFCLHVADAGAACSWLLVFLLPSHDNEVVDSAGFQTAGICIAQRHVCGLRVLRSIFVNCWLGDAKLQNCMKVDTTLLHGAYQQR